MSKPFFSIGMIFKNEIRCLERCLKSLEPLRKAVPCEVVMADTGSTDGSREIAEKYADIVFDVEWVDDFSVARNAVMDRCSGQWYLSIDADEWLAEDITELVAFANMKKVPRDFAGINIRNYKSVELDKAEHYIDFSAIRLARLSTGARYTGRIHEKWTDPDGGRLVISMLEDTWLYHDGYAYFDAATAQAKYKRNMALLEKKLEEDPRDLQTVIECIDSSKHADPKSGDYARRAVQLLGETMDKNAHFAGVVYRGAVSSAQFHKLPEIEEWISQAEEKFPDSIFVNIDVFFHAFSHYFDKDDYEKSIHFGEAYRKSVADYRAGSFNHNEMVWGALECGSPFWEKKLLVSLCECYLECKEYEKAFDLLRELSGEALDQIQAQYVTLMLLRLHRITEFDVPAVMLAFWENLTKEQPEDADEGTKAQAKANLDVFTKETYAVFTPKYRREERGKEDFLRHSYTVFLPLEGRDTLGDSAAILETSDPQALKEKLCRQEKLADLPIHVIAHAIAQGVEFPLPGKPMRVEEMDDLANRLAQEKKSFIPMALKTLEGNFARTLQSLCWARGLALAALCANDWTVGKIPEGRVITLSMDVVAEPAENAAEQSMAIARAFARVEGKYLPLCYTADLLNKDTLFMLPPLHRFGWYCAQAFQALDRGDQVGYVRLLREGLASCEQAKDVAEFLLEHIPDVKPQAPSAEMAALAEQVRAMLSRFAPDDPAVMVLKQSEAYRKVSHLIEGLEPPVAGGLLQ